MVATIGEQLFGHYRGVAISQGVFVFTQKQARTALNTKFEKHIHTYIGRKCSSRVVCLAELRLWQWR